jgi:hypothetical protein
MRKALLGRLLAAQLALGTASAQEMAEEPSALPDGPHRDEVFYVCTACHSSRLIKNQGMSRERWDQTLRWMTERHGMAPLEGEERQRFLDYLAVALGESRDGTARRAPFAAQPQRRNPFAPN